MLTKLFIFKSQYACMFVCKYVCAKVLFFSIINLCVQRIIVQLQLWACIHMQKNSNEVINKRFETKVKN